MELDTIELGDAYELIKKIPDKSVDLIVTDPPYEIQGVHTGTGILKDPRFDKYVRQLMEDDQVIVKGVDMSICDEFVRVMKGINIYIWCNKEQIYDYMTYFVKERKCNFEILIWAKQNPSPFYGKHYLKDKEYCLYFWETGYGPDIPTYEKGKTVFFSTVNRQDKNMFDHPTIKPLPMVTKHIEAATEEGAVILDPFMGSGTTAEAVVCCGGGRSYIGFEKDPKWHRVAEDRMKGITAVQAESGYVQEHLF